MLKVENIEVVGWEAAIRGMRNPMNSWPMSDSFICRESRELTDEEIETQCGNCLMDEKSCNIYDTEPHFIVGRDDLDLMTRLRNAGMDHRKFMRMVIVYLDITAPLYWWKEFDTYKVGTVANSCSTMHKIADRRFEREDFSIEHLENCDEQHWMVCMDNVISSLNVAREKYIQARKNNADGFTIKKYWWQMIQLLPSSYNQRRTVMLNYEVLSNIYKSRRNHKLDEWHTLCVWIRGLPYSQLITGEFESPVCAGENEQCR